MIIHVCFALNKKFISFTVSQLEDMSIFQILDLITVTHFLYGL